MEELKTNLKDAALFSLKVLGVIFAIVLVISFIWGLWIFLPWFISTPIVIFLLVFIGKSLHNKFGDDSW